LPCSATEECTALAGGTCVDVEDPSVAASCGEIPATTGLCLPAPQPVTVSIDPTVEYQSLIGFGASLSHDDDFIVGYAEKEQLYDVMFADSGFEVVRLRNRYELGNEPALAAAREVIGAAEARLGRTPAVFLSSGSPPAYLKANGTRACSALDVGCTLSRTPDGAFDYEGFAQHWRTSIDAYAQVGIRPDFLSIQSNVDLVPPEGAVEACLFLPREGTRLVTTADGQSLEGEFAGYSEAMEAVAAALSASAPPAFAGPEVSDLSVLDDYSQALSNVDSVAYHLYGTDPAAVARGDGEVPLTLRDAGTRPSIQSAMQATGLATAILTHHALVAQNSAGYLQQQFVAPAVEEASTALIGADAQGIEPLPAYFALWHFARFTDPGWVRVEAAADSRDILVSAWASPEGDALTVVLINPGIEAVDVEISPIGGSGNQVTFVYQTAFDGDERASELGLLPEDDRLRIPGHAIVTVTDAEINLPPRVDE
jgi:O-glycosyl hydrolase